MADRTDNGPKFISTRLSEWSEKQGIILHWIEPGKLTQNAYIEPLNGSFRRELLEPTSVSLVDPRVPVGERVNA
jgi:transposase InsO family protein